MALATHATHRGGLHFPDTYYDKKNTSFKKILSFEEIKQLEKDDIIRAFNWTN